MLQKHWPDVPKWRDIKDVTAASTGIKRPILISGGFPCQPFSTSGKRGGYSDPRYLWPEMLRIVKDLRPHWVLGENVANFERMALDTALFDLENAGYSTTSFNIPACGVNAWHKRERVFIVATNTGYLPGSPKQILQPEIPKEPPTSSTGQLQPTTPTDTVGFEWSQLRDLSGRGWIMEQIAWFSSRIWESEPGVGRVVNGVSKGLDEFKRQGRCHALGNAVVPQQVYPILKAIADIEKKGCEHGRTEKVCNDP